MCVDCVLPPPCSTGEGRRAFDSKQIWVRVPRCFDVEQDDRFRLGRISFLSSRNRGSSSRSSNIPSSSLTFVFFQGSEGRWRGGVGVRSREVRGKWLCLLGWPGFGGGGGDREGRPVAQASVRAAYTARIAAREGQWSLHWVDGFRSFTERLVAIAYVVEGVFLSSEQISSYPGHRRLR